jgi:hypothetical protein
MAGDAYRVSVYLAFDKKMAEGKSSLVLDTAEDDPLQNANEAIKAKTGTFEVWRRLHFVRYMKKKAAVTPNFPIAKFQNYYKQAYVRMYDAAGAATSMTKADYDAKVTAAINARTGMKSTCCPPPWPASTTPATTGSISIPGRPSRPT